MLQQESLYSVPTHLQYLREVVGGQGLAWLVRNRCSPKDRPGFRLPLPYSYDACWGSRVQGGSRVACLIFTYKSRRGILACVIITTSVHVGLLFSLNNSCTT
jgi:hypothetical protein